MAVAGAAVIISGWFALLFAGPAPPRALLDTYPTTISVAAGVAAIVLLATRARPRSGLAGDMALLSLSLLIFGIPLVGMWHGGPAGPNVALGLLPLFDAISYETGGLLLAETGKLNLSNGTRPMTAAALSVLFTANGGNLQWTQALLVLINAAAVFAAARVVWRSHGLVAGLLVLITLYLFFSEHLGSLLSENLGLALGAAAFALLWEGIRAERRWLLALGLFALALGLNARAGAFLVLPALVIWLAWRERSRGWQPCAWTFSWTVGAGLLGFVPATLLGAAYAPTGGIAFGNFAPSFYGLVAGGKGWTQVYADHPDINALASLEQKYGEIYRLSWASIVEAPEKLLLGVVRAYGRYIVGTGWHKFFDDSVVRGVAILLTLAGLVECIRRRREEDAAFLLVVTVGVFASVPFLMDGGPRVFAATIPVTAALIGIGAVALARWAGRPIDQIDDTRISPAPAVAIVAFLFVLAGPAVPPAAGSLKRPQPEAHACRDGWVPAVFDHRPGAYLLVWPGDIGTQRLPNVRSADFLEEFPLPDLVTPAYFSRGRERLSDRWGWFVVNGSTEASPSLRLCGQWNEAGVFRGQESEPHTDQRTRA